MERKPQNPREIHLFEIKVGFVLASLLNVWSFMWSNIKASDSKRAIKEFLTRHKRRKAQEGHNIELQR